MSVLEVVGLVVLVVAVGLVIGHAMGNVTFDWKITKE